jgi:hypothetical protein
MAVPSKLKEAFDRKVLGPQEMLAQKYFQAGLRAKDLVEDREHVSFRLSDLAACYNLSGLGPAEAVIPVLVLLDVPGITKLDVSGETIRVHLGRKTCVAQAQRRIPESKQSLWVRSTFGSILTFSSGSRALRLHVEGLQEAILGQPNRALSNHLLDNALEDGRFFLEGNCPQREGTESRP